MSASWRSLSGRSVLTGIPGKSEARLAVDAEGERATSERLTRSDLEGLRDAADEILASWSTEPEQT